MPDFAATKVPFHLPLPPGRDWLDGNSLGMGPVAAPARMAAVMTMALWDYPEYQTRARVT